MPIVSVKVIKDFFTEEQKTALITELTDAFCRATIEAARPYIYVTVEDNNDWMTRAGKGVPFIAGSRELLLLIDQAVDLETEKLRLQKVLAAAEKERDSLAQRLANPSFTERAKPEAVEKARSDHAEKSAEAERYRAALERLG